MRILITGAAGFLGSNLCDRLLAEGHEVVGMDNFITGSPDNLAHLTGHPGFLFIRHDVSHFLFVPGKIDAIMHFASPASPNPNSPFGYLNLPIQTMKAGALGTHNTLGVAKERGARFLLASTSEIYGDTRVVRIFNTYGPRMHLDDGRVVPNFLQQALRREPLTVYGDGAQTRSFCYVDDLIEGIYRLLLSDEHLPV